MRDHGRRTKGERRRFESLLLLAIVVAAVALLTLGVTHVPVSAQAAGPTPRPGVTLTGRVGNADGPLSGAVVRVAVTENKTTTAADGSFTLRDVQVSAPITVTAWTPGHYVGWVALQPNAPEITSGKPLSITMKPHYTTDNLDYAWFSFEGVKGSKSCGLCHPQNPEWEADAHSKAAVNPRFLTMYDGTDVKGRRGPLTKFGTSGNALPPDPAQPYTGPGFKLDYPNRAGNCAACHTPLASKISNIQNCGWSGCHTDLTVEKGRGIVPSAPSPLGLTGDAAEGITCDFCHKIGDVYLDPKSKLPLPDMPGILSYRLYRPVAGQELFFGTFDDIPRRDTYLPLLEESAYCAPCHYGVFGGVVGAGHVTGGVVIYNSYGEWLDSPYSDPQLGKTCQECHMPAVDYDTIVFPERGGQKRSSDQIHNHRMPGAYDETLLQNSVTMTTTAQLDGSQVTVDVAITNDKTGHHVPTDAVTRHMILVVEAKDAQGRPLALRSGPTLPEWAGNYAGRPGQTYAKVLRDEWSGETPTAAYWRPVKVVADTRIPAFGTDRSRYTFELPAGSSGAEGAGGVTVQARLVFRRAFQKLMEQKGWTDEDVLMEQAQVEVKAEPAAQQESVAGACECRCGDRMQ
jgi:hypothetical protein